MLDAQDLRQFIKLPTVVFNSSALKEFDKILNEYAYIRRYVERKLEYFGEDGFKNPIAYEEVETDIRWLKLPKIYEEKILAVLNEMRQQYCRGDENE